MCDSPLTVERAAALAAYMQALAAYLLDTRPELPTDDDFLGLLLHPFHRMPFRAGSRLHRSATGARITLHEHVL